MSWCFRHIFDVLCTISFDVVTLTFDLLTLAVSDELRAWHIQRTYQFLASYDYPFLSCVTQSDHIIITWNGHCACAVSHDLSPGGGRKGKNDPHFGNPWPQFTYSLCNFQGSTTKIKLCYMWNIAFIPFWRLHSSLRMRSIMWPVS